MRKDKSVDKQRRILLRWVAATGCVSLVPMIVGCSKQEGKDRSGQQSMGTSEAPSNSGKSENATSMSASDAPSTGSQDKPDTSSQGTNKLSKTAVQYQDSPKGDKKCSGCMHFVAQGNTCKLVEGQINPDGWCSLWAAKQS